MSVQNSIQEAKHRLIVNVGTNLMVVVVSSVIVVWQTPFLIERLGVEVYGMIPLVVSFIAYFELFARSVSNTVSRFVAINLNRGAIEEGNLYFNSAMRAVLLLCAIFFIPVVVITVLFPTLFQVPVGFQSATSWLFFCIMMSSFIVACTSPFIVSTFIRHRFDLSNIVLMLSKLLRLTIMVLCFVYLSPSLIYFGISYCGMAIFALVCSIALTHYLTPQLRVKRKLFSWRAIREMSHMSVWTMVNELGVLLYLGVSFVIINVLLGPEQCGRYGPVALLVLLLGALGSALTNIFAPIAYEYIAKDKIEVLVVQISRSTKFIGLMIGLPIGLLCGLARPLMTRWLGQSFSDLSLLVWLLVGPWLINIAVRPMFSVYRGLNKVKVPAIVTFSGGILNVWLAIVLVLYTDLGIYGVALALLISLTAKNLLFTTMYTAWITSQRKVIFIREIALGFVASAILALTTLGLARLYDLATIPRLFGVSVLMGSAYTALCYGLLMNREDKALLWSLVSRRR